MHLTSHAAAYYAINTIFPAYAPTVGTKIPAFHNTNIGDRMTAGSVSWNWYSGGWNDAVAGKNPNKFQYHHQPFNYYANYAPGTPGRSHLKDETDFIAAAQAGRQPAPSFVQPLGADHEHPGSTNAVAREQRRNAPIRGVRNGPHAQDASRVRPH